MLHNDSGIAVYTHTWTIGSDLIDENLYSGMLQGISSIIQESLKRGKIEQIKIEDAIIILNHPIDQPVTSIIAATTYSPALNNALALFTQRFINKYSNFFSDVTETSNFDSAINLLEECFPFVPVYD